MGRTGSGSVPASRIRLVVDRPVDATGSFVLYWMTAFRRTRWNFALQRAVDWARRLGRPLVVLEALRCDYPWASARHHRFILDGMSDNSARLDRDGVFYYPFVETRRSAGKGLLAALAKRASIVVTDDSPAFFYPRMLETAAGSVASRLEAVDSCGLLPLSAADRVFTTAASFRRHLQKTLPGHLTEMPAADPLRRAALPPASDLGLPLNRWPAAPPSLLSGEPAAIAALPIDHDVRPAADRGGEKAAARLLARFIDSKLAIYGEERNLPQKQATSLLSPHLHYGHVSSHEIVARVLSRESWTPGSLGTPTGSRNGWWGVSEEAEAFLDQVVTWREVGFNMAAMEPGYERYESLPGWAQKTLRDHEEDPRPHLYDLDAFESASTHDELWNAAQRQLVHEGRIHNYLRMLWGKKILEWSSSPREALSIMVELNNKYALDGRDPNSYSGIFWCLGRYDRPWGPERPIFGKVRYMSSANTRRKMPVTEYVRDHSDQPALGL